MGTLAIRRDRLMSFLAMFDLDLAVFFEHNIETELPDDWRDEGREASRYWRVWTAGAPGIDARAVVRAVHLIRRPEVDDLPDPWGREDRGGIEYPIGIDDATGLEVRASHPPHEYLTSVFFDEGVLEEYFNDPETFKIDNHTVRGGREWSLSIARTGRGTIHAWLGDVAELPIHVQLHWQRHGVVDQGVPEERVQQDLLGQFVAFPSDEPIAALKGAIRRANHSCEARFGHPLYSELDAFHAPTISALRLPANDSMDAFIGQLSPLSLLTVEYLNPDLLNAAGAPKAEGTLNRLAGLLQEIQELGEPEAKDLIGGLYAVQSLRSSLVAHRASARSRRDLERAEISTHDLREGFDRLVRKVTMSIIAVAMAVEAQ